MSEQALMSYLQELRQEIKAAYQTEGSLPFKRGPFIVSAIAEDVEMDISNVTEEDAILIASELESRGIRAIIRDSLDCPHCHQRVPKQTYCVHCRKRIL